MDVFTLFPSLPVEIRLHIWYHCLPPPRRIEILQPYEDAPLIFTILKATTNPTTLAINHESRLLTLEHYQPWEQPSKANWQYISFSHDTIILPISALWPFNSKLAEWALFVERTPDILALQDLRRIENLELTSFVLKWEESGCLRFLEDAIVSSLGEVRRVTLRLLRDEKDNGDARVRVLYMDLVRYVEWTLKKSLRRLCETRGRGKGIVLRIELPDGCMVETIRFGCETNEDRS